MDKVKFDSSKFEEFSIGKEVFGNKYYSNDLLSYTVDSEGKVVSVSIFDTNIIRLGFKCINRIEIGFGKINVWSSGNVDAVYVKKVLYRVIGKENTEYIFDDCNYAVSIVNGFVV